MSQNSAVDDLESFDESSLLSSSPPSLPVNDPTVSMLLVASMTQGRQVSVICTFLDGLCGVNFIIVLTSCFS